MVSCSKTMSPSECIQFVESDTYENKITRKIGDEEFTLIYTPAEYLALKGFPPETTPNKDAYQKELENYKDFVQFIFIIKGDQPGEVTQQSVLGVNDYESGMMYMMSNIQNDFTLIAGEKEYPCVFSHFERNYQLTDKNNIQIVFDRPESLNNIRVIYKDKIFNSGPVSFEFKTLETKKVKI